MILHRFGTQNIADGSEPHIRMQKKPHFHEAS